MTGELSHRPGMMCQFLNSPLKPLEMLPLLQNQSADIKVLQNASKYEVQISNGISTHPVPPSGTPWEADGLQRSFVNGSIGAFCKHNNRSPPVSTVFGSIRVLTKSCIGTADVTRPCDASSRTYDQSLRPRLI